MKATTMLVALCAAGFVPKPSQSIPPNTVCCDLANDEAGCLAYTEHDANSFDNCVGGIGVDCDGVPYDLDFGVVGTLSVNLAAPEHSSAEGFAVIKTSVGSILHDLCCIEHPQGAFCNGANYPIDETINFWGNADNECACIMEWRKAAWNLLRGRYWTETFDEAALSSDITKLPFTQISRESWLPTGSGTNYLDYKSNWGLEENIATEELCAPPGTKLDCPSEDDNCGVSCIWSTCVACESGCTRSRRRRWDAGHKHAGDSDYCCSGEFKEVHKHSYGATRYGVCK